MHIVFSFSRNLLKSKEYNKMFNLRVEAEENAESTNKDSKLNHILKPKIMPCRLCHSRLGTTTNSLNIYEASMNLDKDCDNDGVKKPLIIDVCQSIWGVKYERHEFLPERICERCLEMLKNLYKLRQCMQQREYELQQELNNTISLDAKYRPGLNGNPGVFEFDEREEGCVIVDVDPDQLCETSDDDFLGSDGEADLEEEDWDEEEEEEAQNDDVDIPLGMDAAQMALMQKHQTIDSSAKAAIHPKSAFLCQYCDMAFTLQQDCQQHELGSHDDSVPYSCNYCQLRLSTRPALIAHIKELHDAERPYVCAHCRKGFVRRSDLKKHTIVHTGVRPFSCPVCSKSFSRNTNLTKHVRIHSGVKPFVCQQCPRSFQTPLELMRHARSHTEVKPYQCGRCSVSFARKDKLLMHQQVHYKRDAEQQKQSVRMNVNGPSEKLPFPQHNHVESDVLMQPLQQPNNFQHQVPSQHKLKATSKLSRNFRCDVCDKGFQRERDLQRHRALHMDKLLTCKVCGHGFNRREQLQRHEIEAHGPSFACSICGTSFLHQTELETHLKVHELQHSVAKSTQEALKAVAAIPIGHATGDQTITSTPPVGHEPVQISNIRTSAAEMSFYSNMIPTMNLGFYSETRPEERNGI